MKEELEELFGHVEDDLFSKAVEAALLKEMNRRLEILEVEAEEKVSGVQMETKLEEGYVIMEDGHIPTMFKWVDDNYDLCREVFDKDIETNKNFDDYYDYSCVRAAETQAEYRHSDTYPFFSGLRDVFGRKLGKKNLTLGENRV